MSYIDLLQRFELRNVSNEVIKLSTCSAITCLNQTSTTLHINCSNCKRPMSNKGWICDRCKRCSTILFFESYVYLCTELCLGWDQLLPGVSMAFSSVIPVVTATSSQYTEFYLHSDMNQPLTSALHLSSRCHQCASVCAVCHHVVKGLFVWCQGCSHGGHLEHIMSWLKSSAYCPAGCGHLCEYT